MEKLARETYICRRLDERDIEPVMAMNRDYREGFICREQALAFLRDESCWLFAAMLEQTVIGFAYGYALRRLDKKGKMLYIHEVGVMEPFQRQGIGYAMMQALREACREEGFCRFFLTAYQNNEGANAHYRKLGGQVSGESQGEDIVYHFPVS